MDPDDAPEGRAAGIGDLPPTSRRAPAFDRIVRLAARAFSAPAGALVADGPNGLCIVARRGFDALGLSASPALARALHLDAPPEEAPPEEALPEEALPEETPLIVEDTSREGARTGPIGAGGIGDGTQALFYAGAPVDGPTGDPAGTLCVLAPAPHSADAGAARQLADLAVLSRDGLALRRERREHRQTARRYRALAENFPNGAVFLFDADLRLQVVAGTAFSALDTSPQDLEGRSVGAIDVFPEDVIATIERLFRSAAEGEPGTADLSYAGDEYRLHAVPLSGEGPAGLAISQVVTEERERERKLRRRSNAMAMAADGIALLDADEEYVYVNEAHARIYGYDDPEAFLGRSWRMCYAGEELERFEETIMPALFENGRWQGEAVGRRADGSAFAQRLSLAALEGGNVVCVVRDISDERAAEREQRKRRRKTEALYTASSGLLKARDRDEVAARIMDLVSGTFGYPGMALRLVEDGRLVPAYVSPETADHMPERPALAVDGDSAVAQTFRSGQTAQVDDVRALDDPVDYGDARAAAGIPIADHGILTLMDDEVGGIDPFDLRLVEILTTHAAGVLDRIEREKDLRRSERRFRQVTETIDEVFWLRTREQTLYVSPSFERIWGRSRERLVEDVDAHLAWVHPDDRKAVASAYSALVDDGDSMDTTYRIKRPDGEVRWVDVQFEPVVAARAGGLRFAGVYRDITARRRYQQRLHQSEKTYREIIDEARDAIYVLDADGRFLDANASTAAMLEAGVDALIGLPLTSFLDPSRQDAETVDRHLHAALEGTPQRFKLWAQRSDGTAFPKEVRLQRGSYFGEPALICIARDITERTRRERRLREAKQEAESAARLKSAMLANMSHEVRTPMTNITGFAEVLAEETEGQAQHFAELIHDSGQRLMDTLSSVLQLSKLEAGTARLMRQTVDLAGLAEEIVHEEHTAAPRDRHLDLRLEIGARPAPVDGDPGALQSIIRNLVDNAIKFTGEGGRVTVRVDRVPEDDRVRLVVEDDGAGMSADFQERMFEAFRQEGDADHNPFQREHEGSGLGLAIVKRVVDLYDASIEVDSAPGEGTRIAVRFPPPAEGRPEGA